MPGPRGWTKALAAVLGGVGCSTAAVFDDGTGGATGTAATTGASGSGPATTTAGSAGDGGAGASSSAGGGDVGPGPGNSSSSTGCLPGCADSACGVDDCGAPCGAEANWVLVVDEPVLQLLLDARGSLYAMGDGSHVDRIDVCAGEVASAVDVPGEPSAIRGAGLVGESLLLGIHRDEVVDALVRLDATDLAVGASELDLPTSGETPDRLASGVAHAGSLWLATADDGDGVIRMGLGTGMPTRWDFGTAVGGGGSVSTPHGFVRQQGDSRIALIPDECTAELCVADRSMEMPATGTRLAYANDEVIVPAAVDGEGVLLRVRVPSPELQATLARDVDDGDDAFVDAAVHGEVLFVSGVSGGTSGLPWVLSLPLTFDARSEPIDEVFLGGSGDSASAIVVGDDGVYVAGTREGGGGYVVRCTHDLACPAIR